MSESDGVGDLGGRIVNALIKMCRYKQFQLEHVQLSPFFLPQSLFLNSWD